MTLIIIACLAPPCLLLATAVSVMRAEIKANRNRFDVL